jgi:hypothetical protein
LMSSASCGNGTEFKRCAAEQASVKLSKGLWRRT